VEPRLSKHFLRAARNLSLKSKGNTVFQIEQGLLTRVSGGTEVVPSVVVASPSGVMKVGVGGVGVVFTTAALLPISAGASANRVPDEGLAECLQISSVTD